MACWKTVEGRENVLYFNTSNSTFFCFSNKGPLIFTVHWACSSRHMNCPNQCHVKLRWAFPTEPCPNCRFLNRSNGYYAFNSLHLGVAGCAAKDNWNTYLAVYLWPAPTTHPHKSAHVLCEGSDFENALFIAVSPAPRIVPRSQQLPNKHWFDELKSPILMKLFFSDEATNMPYKKI